MTEGLRVVLVDDHPMFRQGLRTLLEDLGVTVLAEAADGEAGVAAVLEHRPDVVFMDLPIVFNLEIALSGTGDMPYRWDDGYGARFGLLRRDDPFGQVLDETESRMLAASPVAQIVLNQTGEHVGQAYNGFRRGDPLHHRPPPPWWGGGRWSDQVVGAQARVAPASLRVSVASVVA